MAFMEPFAGAAVTILVLLDIFLTVLYARAGTAVFSPVVSRTIWIVFRLVSRPFGRNTGRVLSFCGPVILVALIFVWAAGLALGSALIIHPHLGGVSARAKALRRAILCRRCMPQGAACPSSAPATSSLNRPCFRRSTCSTR